MNSRIMIIRKGKIKTVFPLEEALPLLTGFNFLIPIQTGFIAKWDSLITFHARLRGDGLLCPESAV
jgi:hypothetical protein